jgi:hypothetical protein
MNSCVAVLGSFASIAASNRLSIAVDDIALGLGPNTAGTSALSMGSSPSGPKRKFNAYSGRKTTGDASSTLVHSPPTLYLLMRSETGRRRTLFPPLLQSHRQLSFNRPPRLSRAFLTPVRRKHIPLSLRRRLNTRLDQLRNTVTKVGRGSAQGSHRIS